VANVHILESLAPGRFRVAYHVAIPASNNPAGVAWRTAVVNSRPTGANAPPISVLPDGDGTNGTISAAEKAQLSSGALYEVVHDEKGQTGAGINAMFARRSAEVLAALQARLAQFGRTI
jgi:hypothetical protein